MKDEFFEKWKKKEEDYELQMRKASETNESIIKAMNKTFENDLIKLSNKL